MYALVATIFIFGYILIIAEHPLKIDKAASALLTAILMWSALMFGAISILPQIDLNTALHTQPMNVEHIQNELKHHLSEIAEILFFLMGAMTIVELIDAHDGFNIITDRITTRNKVKLLWLLSFITFFLSAALDNLTSTIVMISLLRKLFSDRQERWLYAGMIVIAANAGGAWSPVGDVTTTMLWIGGQITSKNIMLALFLPSLVCLIVPLIMLSFITKGNISQTPVIKSLTAQSPTTKSEQSAVLILGLSSFIFVPIFKTITHLPPYMGMLFALSVLWISTEIIHRGKNHEDKQALSVVGVIRRIDTPSILFFLGILLAVSALSTAGHLESVAAFLQQRMGNIYAINIVIGMLSSLVDNVPLVAGAIKMYSITTPEELLNAGNNAAWLIHFKQDGMFWEMLAYCAGTGGSFLIIGSAAGVAAMGMEKINFIWYFKKISGLALLGYLSGVATYILIQSYM